MNEMFIPNMDHFNKDEISYLELLMWMIDEQLLAAMEEIESGEWFRKWRARRLVIDDFFENSGIRERWDEITQSAASSADEYVEQFYDIGRRAGYREIGQVLAYTAADKEALFHLKNYNFDLIKSLSADTRQSLRVALTESLAQGKDSAATARMIIDTPLQPIPGSNVSVRTRARMIARTEHARALNNGTLQAYGNLGVEQVEIITAGDKRVCSYCLELEAKNPYALGKAAGLLPAHPNCRCSYAAYQPALHYNPPSNPQKVSLVDPGDRRRDKEHM